MKTVITCLVLAFLASAAQAAELTGTVTHIVDGDGFKIGDVEIRLCGIDAPERGAPDFAASTEHLAAIALGKPVRCLVVGGGSICDGRSATTNRDRIIAQCFIDDLDVAAQQVQSGHAVDYPKFSGGYYQAKP